MDSFSLQPLTTQILTHKKQNKTEEISPDEPEFLFHFDIEDDESNNKVTTSQTLFIRRNKSQRRRDRRKRKSKPLLNEKGDVSETNHTEVIAELNDNNPKNFNDMTTTNAQDVIENCSIHLNHLTIEQSANQTVKLTLMEQKSRQQQQVTNESVSIIEHNVSDPVIIDAVRITQKESNQQHSINDVRSRAAQVIRQKMQNKPGKSQKQEKTLKKKKSGEIPPSPLVRFDVQNTTKLYGITNRQAFAARSAAKTGPIGRPKEKGQIEEEEEESSTNAFAFGFDINIP